jgi:YVTN family beta-propeller protein
MGSRRLGAVLSGLVLAGALFGGHEPAAAVAAGPSRSLAALTAGPGLTQLPETVLLPTARPARVLTGVPALGGMSTRTTGNVGLGTLVLGFGKLWTIRQPWRVVNDIYRDLPAKVISIDARTHRLSGRPIGVGRGAYSIATGASSVWVSNSADGTISRIDPTTRRVLATIRLGGRNIGALAVRHGMLWVLRDDYDLSKHGGELIRIDPKTNTVAGTTILGKNMCGWFGMAFTRGAIWVTADAQRKVIRIDPATGRIVTRIRMDGPPVVPVVSRGELWVADEGNESRLWRIDPATNHVSNGRKFPGLGWRIQPRGGKFWTTDGTNVTEVNPIDGTVQRSIALSNGYEFLFGRNTLWAISWDSSGAAAVQWVDLRAGLKTVELSLARVA